MYILCFFPFLILFFSPPVSDLHNIAEGSPLNFQNKKFHRMVCKLNSKSAYTLDAIFSLSYLSNFDATCPIIILVVGKEPS